MPSPRDGRARAALGRARRRVATALDHGEGDRLRAELQSTRAALEAQQAELVRVRADLEAAAGELGRRDDELGTLLEQLGPFPPGHYYSPIPRLDEALAAARDGDRPPPGIDLRVPEQRARLHAFVDLVGETPAWGPRYQPDNVFFAAVDAFALRGFLATARPARVIEVGSGWSSAAMLDFADERPDLLGGTSFLFIDPDPERLDALLTDADRDRTTILRERVQAVPVDRFLELRAGDVLFVDSSHVTRAGSDVNHLLLDVVPRLPAGVLVHVHDIGAYFEYHEEWFRQGRWWNEAYLLRALLTDNPRLAIRWHSALLHRDEVAAPVFTRIGGGGGSIWLEVTAAAPRG